jgi:hypothetical protein
MGVIWQRIVGMVVVHGLDGHIATDMSIVTYR